MTFKRPKFDYNKLKKLERIEYLLRKQELKYSSLTISLIYFYLFLVLIQMIFVLLFTSAFDLNQGIMFLQKTIFIEKMFKYVIIVSVIIDIILNIIVYDKRLKLKQEMMEG